MNTLVAYHNNQSIKDAVLLQLQAHYDADQIIKGLYWQEGKGCAVKTIIIAACHRGLLVTAKAKDFPRLSDSAAAARWLAAAVGRVPEPRT